MSEASVTTDMKPTEADLKNGPSDFALRFKSDGGVVHNYIFAHSRGMVFVALAVILFIVALLIQFFQCKTSAASINILYLSVLICVFFAIAFLP